MIKQEESRTIRVDQEVYDFLDKSALRASESFNQILRRKLKLGDEVKG